MSTTVQVKNSTKHIQLICVTGLFAAMIAIMTAYICHIPYGANGGYIHFGDALIYLAAVFLPKPYAQVTDLFILRLQCFLHPMQWRQALSEQVLLTDFRDLWYGSLELSL